MSTSTTHTCDKCGKTQEDRKGMFKVWVGVGDQAFEVYPHWNRQADYCKACLWDLGIFLSKKDIPDLKPVPPTLEEMLREIIARVTQ